MHVSVGVLGGQKTVLDSLKLELWEPSVGCWGLNSGPPWEQCELLTAGPWLLAFLFSAVWFD